MPALYPERVTKVTPARLDDLRRDPGAIVAAFDPLYAAIERAIANRATLIVDIGGPEPADHIWQRRLEPVCKTNGKIRVPAIAPGSWLPFEVAGKRFLDVVAADIPVIQAWTRRSRPAAKVLRGDVAAFLAETDDAFAVLTRGAKETSDAR